MAGSCNGRMFVITLFPQHRHRIDTRLQVLSCRFALVGPGYIGNFCDFDAVGGEGTQQTNPTCCMAACMKPARKPNLVIRIDHHAVFCEHLERWPEAVSAGPRLVGPVAFVNEHRVENLLLFCTL